MNKKEQLPIGVFDSGLGGLTVVRQLQRVLPHEHIIYLGDNARVPYGTRSAQTVERYAWNCADFLVRRGLKMLVIACNTASAVAVDSLRQRLEVPVLGVIRAGAKVAVKASTRKRIGVIGTAGTVGSGAYPREIKQLDSAVDVFQNAAPLLVPLVEEGWIEGDVPMQAIQRYVAPLVSEKIDVLLLGCTHYPVLQSSIETELRKMGSDALVVDSATAMAIEVSETLETYGLLRTDSFPGELRCYVTDWPDSFIDVAERFLGHSLGTVEKVDIS
ncbi:MAG: glutamate racemase [Deltaproteobacteria bacterium]|nr:glutamate racemase [Deltaproteobacteria bacterium]MBN2672495.1 glutamate racemase [Deltaproteobacteria bacterium]